jgi:hypothetical protein
MHLYILRPLSFQLTIIELNTDFLEFKPATTLGHGSRKTSVWAIWLTRNILYGIIFDDNEQAS